MKSTLNGSTPGKSTPVHTTLHKAKSPVVAGDDADQKAVATILATAEFLSNHQKQIATLKAKFALHGHALQVVTREFDGKLTYVVSAWHQSRSFTHMHDLDSFLVQISGGPV